MHAMWSCPDARPAIVRSQIFVSSCFLFPHHLASLVA